jgi:hypothetical protein
VIKVPENRESGELVRIILKILANSENPNHLSRQGS